MHALVFAPQKYKLIHFIHWQNQKRFKDRMLDLTLHIRDCSQVVKAKQNTCYLEVWLDSELNRKAHLDKAVAQGTKSIRALSVITGST